MLIPRPAILRSQTQNKVKSPRALYTQKKKFKLRCSFITRGVKNR